MEDAQGYRKLEIYQLARKVSVAIHRISLRLPEFEMFEEGSQIRRSSKSVRSNIVEGYGRRRYKQEFIRFLIYAHASCDETVDHLECIFETGSFTDSELFQTTVEDLNVLGRKINLFTQSVERQHLSVREERAEYCAIQGEGLNEMSE